MHMHSADVAAADSDIVIGPSHRMRAVFDFLHIIADSESTVVITGESGTGKEAVASFIHRQGRRKYRPFVPVSCALFSETLIESELFGHERGAFTGAIKDRPGRFEQAESGTVLLDDIDDVPLSMQVKLLRVLQNRTIERLGSVRSVPVNVRIIAGSKRDLAKMVAEGSFREDLYYRLNVLPVTLPPLRERLEDVPGLMAHFLQREFSRRGEPVPPVSAGVMLAFMRHTWPGNVRELENMCERMAQTNTCGTLRSGCVAAGLMFGCAAEPPLTPSIQADTNTSASTSTSTNTSPISLDARMREVERSLITWALKAGDGNKTRAAELLQIKRSTLQDRITRLEQPIERSDAVTPLTPV